MDEDSLSDASLIEEDEDASEEAEGNDNLAAADADAQSVDSDSSLIIDLPGEPITAPMEEGGGKGDPAVEEKFFQLSCSPRTERATLDPLSGGDSSPFNGWRDKEADKFEAGAKTRRPVLEEELDDEPMDCSWSIVSPEALSGKGRAALKKKMLAATPPAAAATTSPASTPRLPAKVPRMSSSSSPMTSPMTPPVFARRESREWRPSMMLFKPLAAGWVREVIFKQEDDGTLKKTAPPTILYHAPVMPGTKPRVFKSTGELQHFLNTASQTFSSHNFSFRQEVMGAPTKQEIVRGEDEQVEIFPKVPELPQKAEKGTGQASKVSKATSSSPAGLKVKMFSKMMESNSLETSAAQASSPSMSSSPATEQPDPALTMTPFAAAAAAAIISPQQSSEQLQQQSSHPKTRAFDSPSMTITSVTTTKLDTDSVVRKSNPSSSSRALPTWSSQSKTSTQMPPPPPTSQMTAQQASPSQQHNRIVLRPTHSNSVSCSIHCPGIIGFPSLSCCSCHSMFHPVCVGLVDGMDYALQYDFYCIDCQPPPGKENNPFTHFPMFGQQQPGDSSSGAGSSSSSRRRRSADRKTAVMPPAVSRNLPLPPTNLPRGLSITPTSRQNVNSSNDVSSSSKVLNGVSGVKQSPSSSMAKRMRAIESQSVVNISGIKYLVVPHPSQNSRHSKIGSKSSSPARLPILLQPSKDSPGGMPTFEVEETPDGKLLLLPSKGPLKKGENPFAKNNVLAKNVPATLTTGSGGVVAPAGSRGAFLTSDMSVFYSAMLQVFRFLTLQERLRASRVCKLWRDLAHHPMLWSSVSLKSVHVISWPSFVDFLNRCHARRLDMRKLLFVKGSEETWQDVKTSFPRLAFVSEVQFPKISFSVMAGIVAASPSVESVTVNNLAPKEVDLSGLAAAKGLKELRLRVPGGRMRSQQQMALLGVLTTSLTKLSVLGLESLTVADIDSVASLAVLEHLELGDCSSAPATLFQSITGLTKLRSLRLEGGLVGMNVGELRWLSNLEKLELIDVQLKEGFGDGLIRLQTLKKLFLIPFYNDEVAAVNTEIVDSAMSMSKLTHFFLGLTNEWLASMSKLLDVGRSGGGKGAPQKDSFPILVNGVCEMYSLSKLFKILSNAMPNSRVKILKMSKNSTGKQFIDSLLR